MPKQDTTDSEIDDEAEDTGTTQASGERLVALLDPELLGDVMVELSASLGRGSMSLSELANLKDGTLIALDTPLNGMVDLSLNGRLVARGELVSVGDNFGLRITEILARKS